MTFAVPTPGYPFVRLWWPATWNGTPNLTTGAGFERASDHLDFVANSAVPISVLDHDRDRNLSAGDVIDVWSPGGCSRSVQASGIMVYVGPDATTLTFGFFVTLSDGYATPPCGGTPDFMTPFLGGLTLTLAIALPIALVVHLWRRVPRE